MEAERVLVPFNFSLSDEKALDFARRAFFHQSGAQITLFNAYTPTPDFKSSEQTVMGKLKEKLSYLNQKVSEQENALKAVVDRWVREGWPSNRIRYRYRPRKKDVVTSFKQMGGEGMPKGVL